MASQTAIQPVLIGDSLEASAISDSLFDKGVLLSAIRPPTVPQGTARLRVALSASHTLEQIDRLAGALKEVMHD
jgi:8-amino-7-oxononanoate synthase